MSNTRYKNGVSIISFTPYAHRYRVIFTGYIMLFFVE